MFTINDNFIINVKNMDNSVEFYQSTLGLYMTELNNDGIYKICMKNDNNDNCICLIENDDFSPADVYIKSANISKSFSKHNNIIKDYDSKEAHYTFVDLDGNNIHVCSDFEHISMPVITKENDTADEDLSENLENIE